MSQDAVLVTCTPTEQRQMSQDAALIIGTLYTNTDTYT